MIRPGNAMLVVGAISTGSALTFMRTLVLATMIPAEEFGRAALLAVMMSIVDLFVVTGAQARVFQHPKAGESKTLNGLHGVQILRGLLGAVGVLALAWPLAQLAGMPVLVTGFATMAGLPLVLGFAHLGAYQHMREGRHGANALLTVLPAALSCASVWPLAAWLGDWRAFVGMQLVYAVCFTLASHGLVRVAYRPRLSAEMTSHLRFYLPLLAAGALLLVSMQGDRVVVARAFSETVLAGFALALTLTVPLAQIAIRTLGNLLQPWLAQLSPRDFPAAARKAFELHSLAAMALVCGACLQGPTVIAVLFNAELQLAASLVGAVAAVQALRLSRSGLTSALMARGDSVAHLLCNLPRVLSLALAAAVLAGGGTLMDLLWIAAIGELAGLVIAILRIKALVPWRMVLPGAILPLPICATALVLPPEGPGLLIASALSFGLGFLSSPTLRAVTQGRRPGYRPPRASTKAL